MFWFHQSERGFSPTCAQVLREQTPCRTADFFFVVSREDAACSCTDLPSVPSSFRKKRLPSVKMRVCSERFAFLHFAENHSDFSGDSWEITASTGRWLMSDVLDLNLFAQQKCLFFFPVMIPDYHSKLLLGCSSCSQRGFLICSGAPQLQEEEAGILGGRKNQLNEMTTKCKQQI